MCAKFNSNGVKHQQNEQMNITISFQMNFCLIHRLNCAPSSCYINTEIHLILFHFFFLVFFFYIQTFHDIWMLIVMFHEFALDRNYLIRRKCYSDIFAFFFRLLLCRHRYRLFSSIFKLHLILCHHYLTICCR